MKNIFFAKIIVLLFLVIFSGKTKSQCSVNNIKPEKIPLRHKYKFIHNKYLKNISFLNELKPDCYNEKDSAKYYCQEDSFIIKENIDKVWDRYKTISLKETYCGNLVNLGFVYSKKKNKIYYINDNYEGIDEGQIYFIRLNLLGGLKKLIVAYEVTKVDDLKKTINFCYINRGISQGSQSIFLKKTRDGYTKIEHKTFYKSNSKLRDKRIYPAFHRKIVKELHRNLMKSLTAK